MYKLILFVGLVFIVLGMSGPEHVRKDIYFINESSATVDLVPYVKTMDSLLQFPMNTHPARWNLKSYHVYKNYNNGVIYIKHERKISDAGIKFEVEFDSSKWIFVQFVGKNKLIIYGFEEFDAENRTFEDNLLLFDKFIETRAKYSFKRLKD